MEGSVAQLQRQLVDYTASLFHEGILDDQFTQLQQLADESNPEFVVEVVSLFFQDTAKLLNQLTNTLEQQNIDYKKLDAHVHQLKGSSSSIGAHRVQRICVDFRNFCEARNIDGCFACLQQVNQEYLFFKARIQTLFELEKQILAAGGSIPAP
ncbi:hypothetical protein ACFE04_028864 [Oxalis oulophora]